MDKGITRADQQLLPQGVADTPAGTVKRSYLYRARLNLSRARLNKPFAMRSLVAVFFLISVLRVHAQSDELIIQGQTGGLYLDHTVVAKETWYSVGRMYNVDPAALSKYNHLTFAQPLVIGQALKVPLTAVNFSQDGKRLVSESLVPVYHVVQDKEWLYRVSVNHNKVPIPVLEKWNHVTGDQVHAGLHLIVGYLKVRTALSALAKRGVMPGAGGSVLGGGQAAAGGRPAAVPGGGGVGADGTAGKTGVVGGDAGVKKVAEPEKDKIDTVVIAAAAPPRVASAAPVPVAPVVSVSSSAPHFNGGKFKADFSDGGKSVVGQAGTFKSSSGWQDGKYYALINNVAVGTIVKIKDQATGKSVYAKVLGQLPDMKESAGLTVRLSNAAAAELGEGDGKFGVGVSY
jgi:LysM repeat protein